MFNPRFIFSVSYTVTQIFKDLRACIYIACLDLIIKSINNKTCSRHQMYIFIGPIGSEQEKLKSGTTEIKADYYYYFYIFGFI